jgi:hypothetical protein
MMAFTDMPQRNYVSQRHPDDARYSWKTVKISRFGQTVNGPAEIF